MTRADELADRIALEADPAHRPVLAGALAEGDLIARYVPLAAVPGLVRAAWVMIRALDAARVGSDLEPPLRAAAIALLLDAEEDLTDLVTFPAPRDAGPFLA
jgi:hypothetical protein